MGREFRGYIPFLIVRTVETVGLVIRLRQGYPETPIQEIWEIEPVAVVVVVLEIDAGADVVDSGVVDSEFVVVAAAAAAADGDERKTETQQSGTSESDQASP